MLVRSATGQNPFVPGVSDSQQATEGVTRSAPGQLVSGSNSASGQPDGPAIRRSKPRRIAHRYFHCWACWLRSWLLGQSIVGLVVILSSGILIPFY